jgi:hypothetical protein
MCFVSACARHRRNREALAALEEYLVNLFAPFDPPPATVQMLQLALAFVFLTSYAVTLGSFCGPRGKWRAAGVALLAMVVFCFTITPWAMGVVWAALAIGAMGAFVALSLLTSRLLGLDGRRVVVVDVAHTVDAPAAPAAPRLPVAPVNPAFTVPGHL